MSDHAATVREALNYVEPSEPVRYSRGIAALYALVADNERLTAERDEARAALTYYCKRAQAAEAEVARLRIQRGSLVAEVARLREALQDALAGISHTAFCRCDMCSPIRDALRPGTGADVSHTVPDPLPDDETLPVWLGPDPELSLVEADMGAWHDAHPCSCDAICECEETT